MRTKWADTYIKFYIGNWHIKHLFLYADMFLLRPTTSTSCKTSEWVPESRAILTGSSTQVLACAVPPNPSGMHLQTLGRALLCGVAGQKNRCENQRQSVHAVSCQAGPVRITGIQTWGLQKADRRAGLYSRLKFPMKLYRGVHLQGTCPGQWYFVLLRQNNKNTTL